MAEAGDASARLRRLELATEPETELAAHGQSGLLSRLPPGHTEAAVLAAALQQLTAVTRALTHNVRHMNGSLERALLDKEQIDELEGMLNRPEDQFETRIQQAIQYKVEGNLYYKQKRVREAISRYHWAIMHLRGLDPEQPTPLQAFGGEKIKLSPEQTELLYSTECDCYNNLAACLLLSEKVNYERVRDYCLKVLGRQPGNTKALYRAGVSLYNIGDYDRALHYLTEASKICPNDANIKRYIQETELRLNRYYENEKVMYKGMFGK